MSCPNIYFVYCSNIYSIVPSFLGFENLFAIYVYSCIYVHFGTTSGGSRVSDQSCAKLCGVKEILELTVNGFTKDIYYE